MKIPLTRLDRGYEKFKEEYNTIALKILESGSYVMGSHLKIFEDKFASFIGANHCIGVNSGLDALKLSLRALDINAGDEVIVPANTFIASVIAITENGGIPVFVEPDVYYNMDTDLLNESITERTKAILVVHLYGQGANMSKISKIAEAHDLWLIEDCAQSHGAKVDDIMTGSWGDLGCFSFYPTKGLGAFGDGGAIVCEDMTLYKKLKKIRNYGSEKKYFYDLVGLNSRLDELQAGLLTVKLSHIETLIQERRYFAESYLKGIKNQLVKLPKQRPGCESVWHLFVVEVEDRNAFQSHLDFWGIKTGIHYPIPPHLTKAYAYLGYDKGDFPITERLADRIISLPLYDGMTLSELDYVIQVINEYKES